MKRFNALVLGCSLFALAGNALAFGLGDLAAVASTAAQAMGTDTAAGNGGTAEVIGVLRELNVTPQQALGGSSAMLSVAQNQLSAEDYAALTTASPELAQLSGGGKLGQLSSLGGLAAAVGAASGKTAGSDMAAMAALGQVQTLQDAQQAFSSLGMDAAMLGQFAPVLLQYLGSKGVAEVTLQNLAGVWGVNPA